MAHTPASAAGDVPSINSRAHRPKNPVNGCHTDDHSVSAHASSGSSSSSASDGSDAEMHAAADGQHTNGDNAHAHRRHRTAKRSHNNTVATRPHLSHLDQEIVRLIGQQLNSFGLNRTLAALMKETGVEVEPPPVARFREHLLSGEWREVYKDLDEMKRLIEDPEAIARLHWDIGEQELLELLDEQRQSEAVVRLRALAAFEHQPPADSTSSVSAGLLALPPPSSASSSSAALSNGARASLPTTTPTPSSSCSCAPAPVAAAAAAASQSASLVSASRATSPALNPSVRHARIQQLASLLACGSSEELRRAANWEGAGEANWEGAGEASRSKLLLRIQTYLPTGLLLPAARLRTLLQQARELQVRSCEFHCSVPLEAVSLLSDHSCLSSSESFPRATLQVLREHYDEVWYCRFSPNGRLLATGSKDGVVIIWEVDPQAHRVRRARDLDAHPFSGITCFEWSPDSTLLAICGPSDSSDVLVFNVNNGETICRFNHTYDDMYTAVSFFPDGKHFVIGGNRGQFYVVDLSGQVKASKEGYRIQSIQCLADGKTVLAADTHSRIRAYQVFGTENNTVVDNDVFQEKEAQITSLSVNSSGRRALVNLLKQGVHLWDVRDRALVRSFRGCQQHRLMIASCFGGCNQQFIASGSEDCKVYVWHESREEPVMVLEGHQKSVNCVHWNPALPSMLASVSDDGTVRIWGPSHLAAAAPADTSAFVARLRAAPAATGGERDAASAEFYSTDV